MVRKVIGGLVLLAGVGGLGYWGANSHAIKMEETIRAGAAKAVAGSVHGLTTGVKGRDITVQGLAHGEAERDAMMAALHNVNGRRVVVDQMDVLPTATPFDLTFKRDGDAGKMLGHVPSDAARAALAGWDGADLLVLAAGAPAGDWVGAIKAALAGQKHLQHVEIKAEDAKIMISGLARTPVELEAMNAALAAVPEGFTVVPDITLMDDGTPPNFAFSYEATGDVSLAGKLPEGLDPTSVLGLADVKGDMSWGLMGDPNKDAARLAELAGWLPEFDRLRFEHVGAGANVTGDVSPGGDVELIQASMQAALGPDVTVLLAMAEGPEDGATRNNRATGLDEVGAGGFWVPDLAFDASQASCGAQSDAVLARNKINFVTGSARLDARSVRAVKAMSGVMRVCITKAGLRAELGGHTDIEGGYDANMALSQDRAKAVRDALVARGVPARALRAVGYGPTRPIADNATEEGRAANRRTTVTWAK